MDSPRAPRLTAADYDQMVCDDHLRYELLDGVLVTSPRSDSTHSRVHFNLAGDIRHALRGQKRCQGFNELELQINDDTILIPDIMIIYGQDQLTKQRYLGVPLIVIEILSPSSMRIDLVYKLNTYQALGVSEYWIVDPELGAITLHDFANVTTTRLHDQDTIRSLAVPEIVIDLGPVFA